MSESIFLIMGVTLGYTLCYHSMRSANSATKEALDSLLAAFNARFGTRTPVTQSKPETLEPLKDTHIANEKDIPHKAQFDLKPPDLKMLRQQAIIKKDAEERQLQRELGLIKDHL